MSIATKHNIVGFPQQTVESKINMFLDIVGEDSENTSSSYKGHIKEYFMYTLGKELKQIDWEDLYDLTVEHTWNYRQYLLKELLQSANTINSKVACLSSLFQFLQTMDSKINSMIMKVKRMKVKGNSTSYGALTEEELNELYDFCDKEGKKPFMKRMYFEVAIVTGLRKSAILKNFTWENIKKRKDQPSGTYIWTISEVRDKGNKKDIIPISDSFYNRLMELKNSKECAYVDKSSKVIQLDKKTVDSVLRRYKEKYDIDVDRNIALHSLKKTGCDMVWERTKDIKAVCDYAHHEDINTTYNNYLGKNDSLLDRASYFAFEKDNSFDILKTLSHEELLKAISKSSVGTINEIICNIE